ncbi:hypothetical protein HHI36_018800 [Cryptolaemus montrouzieri]|uniref:MADF domain-containing protein n=1 Tax=Cryptolaemus montrouzieri TaxID=559131 RepID=A0ABD2P1D8_9CUCU
MVRVLSIQSFLSVDAAYSKWKTLRDCYLRFKKSVKASNIHTEIEDSVSLGNEDQEFDHSSEENGTQETPVSLKMPPPPPQKRKVSCTAKNTSHSDVDKVIHYLHNKTTIREYDGIDHSFLSYAETFRKFQPATQAVLHWLSSLHERKKRA